VSLVVLFGFISYGMIIFIHESLGLNIVLSKLLAELALFIASFAIQRDFIFSRS
jgi:hypothetical protein